MIRSLILILIFLESLSGVSFHHRFNRYGGGEVRRLKVVGERCTGTDFVLHLLHRNIWDLQTTGHHEYGHKHFLWWCGAPANEEMLTSLGYGFDAVDFTDSDDCLFVVVVRDPYDWAQSFYVSSPDPLNRGFSYFTSRTWELSGSPYGSLENRNPWTGRPFCNLFELRKYKQINYFNLRKCVSNYTIVRYEDVHNDPEGFIEYIARQYCLRKTSQFIAAEDCLFAQSFFLSDEEATYMTQEIDWDIESIIGYSPRD